MSTAVAAPLPEHPDRLRADLIVTAVAGLLLLAWDFSGLDLVVSGWFGGAQGFALREAWWTRDLLHEGGRMLAWLLFLVLIVDCWRPFAKGANNPDRRDRLVWLTASIAALLLIPTVKRFSTTSCPWDLDLFGGVAHYVSHWQFGVLDGGAGHCFPSGHAVAAYAFFSSYFLWRDHRPLFARALLAGVLMVGALFGLAQMARGAHYPSHTLWSAWLCWALCVGWTQLAAATRRPRAGMVEPAA